MSIETIKLNHNFTLEVFAGNFSDCDLYFSSGKGYYGCDDSVNIDVNKAKEIISALTKFVTAKECK
jgi:hypothetical protein